VLADGHLDACGTLIGAAAVGFNLKYVHARVFFDIFTEGIGNQARQDLVGGDFGSALAAGQFLGGSTE
jgi:hypothetical protein